MPAPDLIYICLTSFGAVFVLLMAFAAVIQLITVIFPAPEEELGDAAVCAAIAATTTTLIPGARVTRIKELT